MLNPYLYILSIQVYNLFCSLIWQKMEETLKQIAILKEKLRKKELRRKSQISRKIFPELDPVKVWEFKEEVFTLPRNYTSLKLEYQRTEDIYSQDICSSPSLLQSNRKRRHQSKLLLPVFQSEQHHRVQVISLGDLTLFIAFEQNRLIIYDENHIELSSLTLDDDVRCFVSGLDWLTVCCFKVCDDQVHLTQYKTELNSLSDWKSSSMVLFTSQE